MQMLGSGTKKAAHADESFIPSAVEERPERSTHSGSPGNSKVKLALGAASLFLFIVGIKRTFRRSEDGEIFHDVGRWAAGDGTSPTPGGR